MKTNQTRSNFFQLMFESLNRNNKQQLLKPSESVRMNQARNDFLKITRINNSPSFVLENFCKLIIKTGSDGSNNVLSL